MGAAAAHHRVRNGARDTPGVSFVNNAIVELADNHDMRRLAHDLRMRAEIDAATPDQVICTLTL